MVRLHSAVAIEGLDRRFLDVLLDFGCSEDGRPTQVDWRALICAIVEAPSGKESESVCVALDRLRELMMTEGVVPSQEFKERLSALGRRFVVRAYPEGESNGMRGVLLIGSRRPAAASRGRMLTEGGVPLDDGDADCASYTTGRQVRLEEHTGHVVADVRRSVGRLPLARHAQAIVRAAELHDWGKADPRFQALLRGTTKAAVPSFLSANGELLAKSGSPPRARRENELLRRRAGVPRGFRHEALSLQLAERLADLGEDGDLILHLIASHHGHGRPVLPSVIDEVPPSVRVGGVALEAQERAASAPPHRVGSGVGERFEDLTRRFGWWALAYLEAILRLADAAASAREADGVEEARDESASTRNAPQEAL